MGVPTSEVPPPLHRRTGLPFCRTSSPFWSTHSVVRWVATSLGRKRKDQRLGIGLLLLTF
ncbi:MAG: hypothetical protein ACJA2C_000123 [Marinoscillum sp.]|jgi:hypothetical protein